MRLLKRPAWLTLETWHKGIYPGIQLTLTAVGLCVAYLVFGVQLQNAARSDKELNNRVANLKEVNDRLERQNQGLQDQQKQLQDQQKQLQEQQKSLAETVRVGDARELANIKTAADLYKRSVDLYQRNMDQNNALIAAADMNADGFVKLLTLQTDHTQRSNSGICLLGVVLTRMPWLPADERALIVTMMDMTKVENELIGVYTKHHKEHQEAAKRLREDYLAAAKTARGERLEELSREYLQNVRKQSEELNSRVNKDFGERIEKINKLSVKFMEMIKKSDQKLGKKQ